ncbi:hypothetical protein BLA24_28795 [Streptomyces cinnamoneus]|uniref:Uncharacterized protein n=1 Tax=Streptomyces cinnamoneus TaxID=53446 RepID=A0A2G1XBS6_STRCJ|nr:hypothetical protein [Streptomyces cinnamoneus]PHQ48704.1 hypothetical protein BLA24_28795 [Streptomyces cinnamoneus]PPT12615.1 hypothetical protein CYQ11_06670 [Streptomyces cinnamoneus]
MSAGRQAVHVPGGAQHRTQSRLPWWALALPLVAFATLFSLLAQPASADTGGGSSTGGVSRVVQFVRYFVDHTENWAP